ncbi:EAL domain-containing protein [Litoribrevibacter albus]|nr:transporter substrate-binding domain-containing protein [Litoribrevibacter albus]
MNALCPRSTPSITVSRVDRRLLVMLLVWLVFMSVMPLTLQASESSVGFELTEEERNWLDANPVINVGVMNGWPPFNFVNKQGVSAGIGADYVELLNRRIGGHLKLMPGEWHQLYKDVQEKRLDALMDLTPKPERMVDFNFTAPYLNIPHVIIGQKTAPYLHDEQDLNGKVVALEKGFGNVKYFEQFPYVQIKEYPDTQHALDAVARGEADAYAGNRSVALYIMGQELMTNLKAHGRLKKDGSILAIGVRKDWSILANLLDRALADITQEEKSQIQQRWLGGVDDATPVKLTDSEEQWLKAHPKVTIAFDGNYPPYSYLNEQGALVGIAVDMANELASRIGIELEAYPEHEWKTLYNAALDKKVDVIATLVKRPERAQWFEFTRPYISLSQFIITQPDKVGDYSSPQALSGKSVALVEGYSTTALVMEQIPDIEPVYVPTLVDALEAVSIGKVDATVADIAMSNHIRMLRGLDNLAYAQLYTRDLSKQRFGVRKDWKTLAVILDKALESFSYQELMTIYTRWNVPRSAKPESGFLSVMDQLTSAEREWLKTHPKIRLASDPSWLPFESYNGETYSGIAADYMKLIEKRLGIEFVPSPKQPWSKLTELVKNKQLDVYSCAMATPQRKQYANFTEPYLTHPMMIITRDDIGYIDGISGLYGKEVAIEKGYASADILSTNHPAINLVPFEDSLSAILAVSQGKTYAYVGNIATASHLLRKHGIENVKVSGQTPYNFQLAMGVRNDWPALVPILQKALDSISLEERQAIARKWISIEVEEAINYQLIWQISAISLLIIAAVLYWNFMLNRKVKAHASQLIYQSNFDALTDLPNRYLVLDRTTQLLRESAINNQQVAVMSLDIDDFKKINDSLDFETGNKLLVEVSRRLLKYLKGSDTLGRTGGDHFVVLLGHVRSVEEVTSLAEDLLNSFQRAYYIDEHPLILTASIGIAISPDDADSAQFLLKHADAAMHHAKQLGKNRISFYTRKMNLAVTRRLTLEEHMTGALARGEFITYFQPKVEVKTRKIVGFEALLRWQSPELGLVSPMEFIPIAEHSGLIVPIGEFVLEASVQMANKWHQMFGQRFHFAVNLSPQQFECENLVTKIRDIIYDAGVSTQLLELEITEGVLMNSTRHVQTALNDLKELGVRLAIDDFGTGYSSLSYLRRYAFNTLKIDREFINDIATNSADFKLVNAAVAMSHGLGLKVVAEGVETEEQFAYLVDTNCDLAQGFLFSKPLPPEEMEQFMLKHPDMFYDPEG